MRRIMSISRKNRIRRIMGVGNGRPQALASVAYSYLRPSPFSGPWVHHIPRPQASLFNPTLFLVYFLSPILSFYFPFSCKFTFISTVGAL